MKIKAASSVISFFVLFLFSVFTVASPKDGSHTFHAAKAYQIDGAQYDHVTVNVVENNDLVIKGCNSCTEDRYEFQELASKVINFNVYKRNDNDYIFEQKSGLLVWANFPKGLEKKSWTRRDSYNILAKDRSYVRQLYTDQSMQDEVKQFLLKNSKAIKKEFAKVKSDQSVTMR